MKREHPSVLLIQANKLQSDLIRVTLNRHLMQTTVCHDPRQLRQLLIENAPDVLLVDTSLPGQNGLDLVEQLNAETRLHQTKILFISALGYPEIVQKAARLGASGFLVKPVDTDLMVKRILQCVTKG